MYSFRAGRGWLAVGCRGSRGDEAGLDAGEEVGQDVADAAVQAMDQPIEGEGVANLDGPEVALDVDDGASEQELVEGGTGHAQAEHLEGILPPLFH